MTTARPRRSKFRGCNTVVITVILILFTFNNNDLIDIAIRPPSKFLRRDGGIITK